MYILNQAFYYQDSVINYINISTNILINNNPSIVAEKEYWLFYFIKDDVQSVFNSLYGKDISLDFLGFPEIQRITRNLIESYLDLINLHYDKDGYLEVMKSCVPYEERKNREITYKLPKEYVDYRHDGHFTIMSKAQIAEKKNGINSRTIERLLAMSNKCNSYVHPDVFLPTINRDDIDQKADILQELLH